MKKLCVLILMVALFVAFGCLKGKEGQQPAKSEAGAPAGKGVLAKVGDYEITEDYVNKVIEALPEAFRSQYLTSDGKKMLVETIVDMEVFYREAEAQKVEKNPLVAFKLDLARKQLVSAEYVDRELKNIAEPTEQEIEKYYNENKDMFKRPAQARVRHILVSSRADAEKIKKDILGGADFGKLAQDNSRDPSKVKGGELGWLDKGQTVQQFDEAIFSLPLNKPEIVETQFGFHVVDVMERRDEGYRDLAEVKDEIANMLKRDMSQRKYQELTQSLRTKYNAQIFGEKPAEQGQKGQPPQQPQ